MATLMQASRQWATRPADERFTSLLDMQDHFDVQRLQSKAAVVSSRKIQIRPAQGDEMKGLEVVGPNGAAYAPTNWSFSQLSQLAEAPAGYMRTLPAPIAADCLNYGLQYKREVEDIGVLLQRNGSNVFRAATGPRYGRIWNGDVVRALVDRFGDGITGDWRVPGEFSQKITVTKDNTTLFAGDRDMFVFLADEDHRIEMPNRRNGQPGTLARGFFMWNSEVGSSTFGLGTFLFDYACCNRMVWGAEQYKEVKIRHSSGAPDRFIEEVAPALKIYSESSTKTIEMALADARQNRLDNVDDFLSQRFGKGLVSRMKTIHELEEGRPVETRWDAVTAATAYAKTVTWQNERVAIERQAGELLDLKAN